MAATAVACLWLLWRVGGLTALEIGLAAGLWLFAWSALPAVRASKLSGYWAAMAAVAVAVAVSAMPQREAIERAVEGVEQWSEAAVGD
jgi:hypothetical protein